MHNVGAPVKLFAAAVDGSVRQYDKVQLWGGNHDDMPVNGNLSVESDRELIWELQEKLELCFGLHINVERHKWLSALPWRIIGNDKPQRPG